MYETREVILGLIVFVSMLPSGYLIYRGVVISGLSMLGMNSERYGVRGAPNEFRRGLILIGTGLGILALIPLIGLVLTRVF